MMSLNKTLTRFQYKSGHAKVLHYPVKLTIDSGNICNLHCMLCPVGRGDKGRRQLFMTFETFAKVIKECGRHVAEIDMFNWGEPLLNKDIFRMIELAKSFKLKVNISTNLNMFNDDICRRLITSGLDTLTISLHGGSQNSVEKYQVGNNFEKVVENMRQVVNMRKASNSSTPYIQWRFLVNKYNECELESAKKLAEEIGVDRLEPAYLRCDMGKELLRDKEAQFKEAEEWLPSDEKFSLYDYSKRQKKEMKPSCRILWYEAVIHPDGSVSPCHGVWDEKFDFGNINDSSFFSIWNSQKYTKARMMDRGAKIDEQDHICSLCKRNEAGI